MIRARSAVQKREIDLSGPDGNAFVLLGIARQYARSLNLDADAILTEMRDSDYEHLLQVFDHYFGCVVDLVRNGSHKEDDDD